MIRFLLALPLLLLPALAHAQTPPSNPAHAIFEAVDWTDPAVTAIEVDIIDAQSGSVLQTLTIPKASVTAVPGTTPQQYDAPINVQPVAFGEYLSRARLVAGAFKSPDSSNSNLWRRVPGAPSRLILAGLKKLGGLFG